MKSLKMEDITDLIKKAESLPPQTEEQKKKTKEILRKMGFSEAESNYVVDSQKRNK